MNEELRNIKEDWVEVELGDIAEWGSGGTPKSTNSLYYNGEIPWLIIADLNDSFVSTSQKSITELGLKESSAKMVKPDSVLVAMYGSIGKLGINTVELATNQAIAFTKTLYSSTNNRYLFNYLLSIRPNLHKLGKGATQKNISQTVLKVVKFPLAPLPIQRSIVSKIESLFSDLDNGIANLKKAQEQLKIYRQAVLKKAFEGELTKEWREQRSLSGAEVPTAEELLKQIKEERQNHYNQQIEDWKKAVKEWEKNGKDGKKPTKPKAIKELPPLTEDELKELPKLPEGWKWMKLDDFGFWSGGGTPSKSNKDFWENGDTLWITSKDMKRKDISDSQDKITRASVSKSSAKLIGANSILVVLRSGILRRILPVAISKLECTINQDLQALTPYNTSSDFIYWYLVAKEYNIRHKCAKSGTTVESVEAILLKSYPTPLCSIPEQHQIVSEIESRLSVTDNLEFVISNSLQKAKALRQSILKKAFEGKLLSEAEIEACKQEKDYEPASVLLARIERSRNEKIKAGKVKTQNYASQRKTKNKAKK